MPSSNLKIGALALAILVGVGVVLYVSNLHPLEPLELLELVEPEYSAPSPLPEEEATQEAPAKSYPRTVYVNGVELKFSEYHGKYFSQGLGVSEVTEVRIVCDPEGEILEFWVDVNSSKLYEAVRRVWNESGVIYAKPNPPFSLHSFIERPVFVNYVYRHLQRLHLWIEVSKYLLPRIVTIREIVESGNTAIHLNIS